MSKFVFFLLCYTLCVLSGCAANVRTSVKGRFPPRPISHHIEIFMPGDFVSKTFYAIGYVRYEDSGFSVHCDESDMLDAFSNEARKIGGDAISIAEIRKPDSHSTCYRGMAIVLRQSSEKKNPTVWSDSNEPLGNQIAIESVSTPAPDKTELAPKQARMLYVAVLETVSDGATQKKENIYLTNVLREEAIKILRSDMNFTIMTRDNISQMLPPDVSIEECEGLCLVETGRNIAADFVVQARVSSFGNSLTLSAEMYETASNKLIYSLNVKNQDVENLERNVREKVPAMFGEVLRLSVQSR